MPRVTPRYVPRKQYTAVELREALILDLESDLAFSHNNDPVTPEWVAYQNRIVTDLVNLRAGGKDDRL
jgi:hypothetical protein